MAGIIPDTGPLAKLGPALLQPPGLKRIEEVRAARARIDPGQRAQADPVDAPGVVVDPAHERLLDPIDPEHQPAIVHPDPARGPPVQLDGVRRITDRDPVGVRPGRAVAEQPSPQLVGPVIEAEVQPQHFGAGTCKALEEEVSLAARHRERVRVEVEARPVARLGHGTVIGEEDRRGVIDHGLQAVAANERSIGTDAQIARIRAAG